ncbi:MAG: alpha/beta hydrolase [Ramlibacter sp.]|nr:alpha/beta hydrolase [Cryobacterium sp.]
MKTGRHPARLGSRPSRLPAIVGVIILIGAVIAGIIVAAGFRAGQTEQGRPPASATATAPGGSAGRAIIGIRTFVPPDDITVTSDVAYGTQPDGTPLRLDVCSPAGATDGHALPAIVSVHAGSWTRGDKANDDWRTVCQWLASEGFVVYSVDYRLAPDHPFPAGVDDLATAVEWIRQPDHAREFGIDPARIGAFGGSAGANLAALLGTRGSGPTSSGSRVAAVAELSGPSDLTGPALTADGASERLQKLVRHYLGCATLTDCPQAAAASPTLQLDRSDPPVFIVNSEQEFVPLGQATRFAAGLDRLGIPHELVTVAGSAHSIGTLDAPLRVKVAAFLHGALGD